MKRHTIAPAEVHATLARHMLADGYDMVLDLEKSHGRRLYDSRSGREVLDLFSFFATLPVGFNHPGLKDPDFLAALTRAALVNPTNSDIYTTEFAEFVEVFGRVAMRPWLDHSFFIAGGAVNIGSFARAQGHYNEWLWQRVRRLMKPTVVRAAGSAARACRPRAP